MKECVNCKLLHDGCAFNARTTMDIYLFPQVWTNPDKRYVLETKARESGWARFTGQTCTS